MKIIIRLHNIVFALFLGSCTHLASNNMLSEGSPKIQFNKPNPIDTKHSNSSSLVVNKYPIHKAIRKNDIKLTMLVFAKTQRFDLDNINKPILDSLEGIIYHNDKQVKDLHTKIIKTNNNKHYITYKILIEYL